MLNIDFMDSLKNISVIFPTFNRSKILRLCLDSLVFQNYPKSKYEIIVVDNNSSDNTKSVVEFYQKEYPDVSIRYILEKTPGAGNARNSGVKIAKYNILSFTDDDGILHPDWLLEISKIFSKNPELAAVAGKIVVKWNRTPPQWVESYEHMLGVLDYGPDEKTGENIYINLGNFNIKKSILLKLGGFNSDQIGDTLVANGETGINEKLWANNYLIGWAPKAIMEHYQLVEKNATIADIKRRYVNQSKAKPYQLFFVERKGYSALIVLFMKRVKSILKNSILVTYYSLIKNEEKKLQHFFYVIYFIAQIRFIFKVIFDKSYRNFLWNEENNKKGSTTNDKL